MLIIVTGAIGIGKTTVCRKAIDIARGRGFLCGGVLTDKAPDGGIVIEDIATGMRRTLASRGNLPGLPQVGAYSFYPHGLSFGIEAIFRAMSSEVLVIDEVGPLELRGEGFAGVVALVQGRTEGNVVFVIRQGLLPDFTPMFREPPVVFETTENNRNRLPLEIGAALASRPAKNPGLECVSKVAY